MSNEKELKNKLDKVEEERKRYLLEDGYKRYWEKKAEGPKFFISNKKVYLPDMDELYKMQDMGANIYNYLLIKAGEALIIDGINHPHKGILKNAYKYLREDYNLATMICSMYPVETIYSEIARFDTSICSKLLDEKNDSIYRLDNLAFFDTDSRVIEEKAINILNNELSNNPKYRFEYQSNKLLDDIFAVKYDYSKYYSYYKQIIWEKLINLEPAYILTKDEELLKENNNIYKENILKSSILSYLRRYNLSQFVGEEYEGKDVLTNPDTEVKRLIKCINERR